MKTTLAILALILVLTSLSACGDPQVIPGRDRTITGSQPTDAANLLSRQEAISLALEAAQLPRDSVYDLEAELDRERGNLVWEVDFETREYEYSYHIHAETGETVRTDRERN